MPEWNPIRARLQRAMHLLELGRGLEEPASSRLDERASRLAEEIERAQAEGAEAECQVFDFQISGATYLMETRYVTEVAPLTAVVPLPLPPRFFVGIASVRGEIVPVVDLVALLADDAEQARFPDTEARWLVLLGVDRPDFAFAVDGVGGVAPHCEPAPPGASLVSSTAQGGTLIRGDLLIADSRLIG